MLDIKSTLRPAPFKKGAGRIPFEKIARAVLGARFELSLVLCGDTLAQKMNAEYRDADARFVVLIQSAGHDGQGRPRHETQRQQQAGR